MASKNSSNNSAKVAGFLSRLLADTYVLYVKTQNFHWNLRDSRFYSLHLLFEKQYEDLAEAVDEIAERIRMIEQHAPASMAEFLKLSHLKEATGNYSGDKMISELCEGHEQIARFLKETIEATQNLGDEGTADLMIQRLKEHDKTAWFLRSHL